MNSKSGNISLLETRFRNPLLPEWQFEDRLRDDPTKKKLMEQPIIGRISTDHSYSTPYNERVSLRVCVLYGFMELTGSFDLNA